MHSYFKGNNITHRFYTFFYFFRRQTVIVYLKCTLGILTLLFVSLMWKLCCFNFCLSPVLFLPCQIKACVSEIPAIYYLFLGSDASLKSEFINYWSINHISLVFNYPAVVYLKNRHHSLCKNVITERWNQPRKMHYSRQSQGSWVNITIHIISHSKLIVCVYVRVCMHIYTHCHFLQISKKKQEFVSLMQTEGQTLINLYSNS